MTTDFENWITEELERLLQDLIFRKDRVAETFSERADLNLEIQRINKLSTERGGFPKVTKNGVWGDPTSATKKDGEKFLAEIVRNLAKECQS